MSIQPLKRLARHLRRGIVASVVVTATSLVAVIIGLMIAGRLGGEVPATQVISHSGPLAQLTATAADHGWGSKAIVLLHADLLSGAGIRPANACGLGATSCYKCHNGTQAAAPDNKPWHVQHIPVNYSCNGCHQGNPRLMNKVIAHSGLLSDPLTNPAKACATCHTDPARLGKYLASYKQIAKKKD